jgi:hypothetical protein
MTWIDEFRRGSLDFSENSVHVVIFRLPRKIQLGCLLTHVETTLIFVHSTSTMVSITVSLKGKPTINCDFAAKSPNNVTVKDIKAAIQAKFPKVSPPHPSQNWIELTKADGIQPSTIDFTC